jgi:hypothetical protein
VGGDVGGSAAVVEVVHLYHSVSAAARQQVAVVVETQVVDLALVVLYQFAERSFEYLVVGVAFLLLLLAVEVVLYHGLLLALTGQQLILEYPPLLLLRLGRLLLE